MLLNGHDTMARRISGGVWANGGGLGSKVGGVESKGRGMEARENVNCLLSVGMT